MFTALQPMYQELQEGVVVDFGGTIGRVLLCMALSEQLCDLDERHVHDNCKSHGADRFCCACSLQRRRIGLEDFDEMLLLRRTHEQTTMHLKTIAGLPVESQRYSLCIISSLLSLLSLSLSTFSPLFLSLSLSTLSPLSISTLSPLSISLSRSISLVLCLSPSSWLRFLCASSCRNLFVIHSILYVFVLCFSCDEQSVHGTKFGTRRHVQPPIYE
jgi:hypothetical protein